MRVVSYPHGSRTLRILLQSSSSSTLLIDRIDEAAHELRALFKYEQLRDAKLLVLVSKQDKPGCKTAREINKELMLKSYTTNLHHIKSVSISRGEGVHEGLEWLEKVLSGRL